MAKKNVEGETSMPRAPLIVAGIVFALVALLHAARIYYQIPVMVDSNPVPYSANWAGLVISGLLSIWMFCSVREPRDRRPPTAE